MRKERLLFIAGRNCSLQLPHEERGRAARGRGHRRVLARVGGALESSMVRPTEAVRMWRGYALDAGLSAALCLAGLLYLAASSAQAASDEPSAAVKADEVPFTEVRRTTDFEEGQIWWHEPLMGGRAPAVAYGGAQSSPRGCWRLGVLGGWAVTSPPSHAPYASIGAALLDGVAVWEYVPRVLAAWRHHCGYGGGQRGRLIRWLTA